MNPHGLPQTLGGVKGGAFYLHGSDEVRKEASARALVAEHLDPATRDFNYDLLRGSDVDVETLASVLGTPPMMAEWRVVFLREVQALAGSQKARTVLLDCATSPPPGLALIMLGTEPQGSAARFYKDLKSAAHSMEFRPPGANDLPGWLMDWCREHHQRELDEDAARALAQAVGADVSMLAHELDKLSTLVDPGQSITLQVVEAAGTRLPRQDRWQWFDLVAEARFREALDGLPVLLEQGESGVALTAALGTHFLRMGLVVDAGPAALSSQLPPHQRFLAGRIEKQARTWSRNCIRRALDGLLDLDRLLKSSAMSDAHLLESWILDQWVGRDEAA